MGRLQLDAIRDMGVKLAGGGNAPGPASSSHVPPSLLGISQCLAVQVIGHIDDDGVAPEEEPQFQSKR